MAFPASYLLPEVLSHKRPYLCQPMLCIYNSEVNARGIIMHVVEAADLPIPVHLVGAS